MKTIIVDDKNKSLVLDLFDKTIDDEGYVIEKETKLRVMTPDGNEVKADDFAGFVPGSEIVLTKDLPSLLQYANTEV